jgi:UDP-2-acetamido-2,6-beta-L-arabino-hexul-4-ose reductase
MKIKVGITGHEGFIGSHLHAYLLQKPEEIELIEFDDSYFHDAPALKNFLGNCDFIVHLAAMNRTNGNQEDIFKCNTGLIKTLITTLNSVKSKPHIIYSSSIQEDRNNIYGNSKKEGRFLLEYWAAKNKGEVTSLILPNIFGPFGLPFYNSVVATFSYELTHGALPHIETDAELHLLYINDLVEVIYDVIKGNITENYFRVGPSYKIKVSELLNKLLQFKELYIDNNIFPDLSDPFDVALFNTFRSYIEYNYFPVNLETHTDNRGCLFECVKPKGSGQLFFSSTNNGFTRGNHYHRRKIERFCVVQGDAILRIRKIGSSAVHEYHLTGNSPSFVDIPVLHTHNISNTGNTELLTLFWSNEFFDPSNNDTYFEEV